MGLRQQRLGDEIRDIIASYFQGGRLSDPALENVTITAVKLSGDLQNASIFYRVYLDKDLDEVMRGLRRASGFFRKKLAESLDVRRVPELRFFYDESIERGARIEELLDQVRQQG